MSFFYGQSNQEEGVSVYNIHNIVEKHFSVSIAPVQSRGGLLDWIILER
jgi:hypothetical protein